MRWLALQLQLCRNWFWLVKAGTGHRWYVWRDKGEQHVTYW